jgi:hypothetical protein
MRIGREVEIMKKLNHKNVVRYFDWFEDERYHCIIMELLEGTIEKLLEWDRLGYNIILTTGRKEGLRQQTERQLQKAGIFYDQLIMGLGGGARYLINDNKPTGTTSSFSICIERNKGIKDINI